MNWCLLLHLTLCVDNNIVITLDLNSVKLSFGAHVLGRQGHGIIKVKWSPTLYRLLKITSYMYMWYSIWNAEGILVSLQFVAGEDDTRETVTIRRSKIEGWSCQAAGKESEMTPTIWYRKWQESCRVIVSSSSRGKMREIVCARRRNEGVRSRKTHRCARWCH